MNRRKYLKLCLLSATKVGGVIGLGWPFSYSYASSSGVNLSRVLVHVMLGGGADLRYAFVPTPNYDPDYVRLFWHARNSLYGNNYPDFSTMFQSEYSAVTDPISGFSFGIHNSCAWLKQQFIAGNVAIVANVFGSLNRRHDHSQLIVNTGDRNVNRLEVDRDGWGGRLAERAGGASKVVSISKSVPIICHGSNPGNRMARVFHGQNMRDISLPSVDISRDPIDNRNVMNRALLAYYVTRSTEVESENPTDWPYHHFFRHYSSLRTFGESIKSRLAGYPLPPLLANLQLKNPAFETQCRNLYDCCLASDILDMKMVSMTYNGWDHHVNMRSKINNNMQDVFGTGGGLDVLSAQLDADLPGTNENLVYLFGSDFGRQLAANGGNGTDHGRGNYSILIGNSVNGGVYGEMFPTREAVPEASDSLGRTPFEIPGHDIEGLTSFERILAAACDWAVSGAGASVFPNAATSKLEQEVDLTGLFLT